MARNQRVMSASIDQVFGVLADPMRYAGWVVGADRIRAADPTWPEVGSRFHHRVGWDLIGVDDHTEVLAVDPPRRLELRARARPLGTAHVVLLLEAHAARTLVTMVETAGDPLSRLVLNRLSDPLVRRRNAESLRRLEALALGRAP